MNARNFSPQVFVFAIVEKASKRKPNPITENLIRKVQSHPEGATVRQLKVLV